ncbi:MAG: hypothetical protein HY365_00075 [Candidatus Aenigmarchaeota archaeon]|nr:hypothetical protein [Candidatus Aenigmarchaeota archaeon]
MVSAPVIAGAFMLVLLIMGGFVYITVFSPPGEKQELDRPRLGNNENVGAQHVAWLANEIGAYKIHASPTGEKAVFEVVVEGTAFSVTAENGVPVVSQNAAESPDLRITASRAAFGEIMNSKNLSQTLAGLYSSDGISIAVEKGEATLALKGYMAVYNEIVK